jgi:putative ubiquitin-RnfH superfamily antitoxin RatB of RatAB toxin-antitoxin module
MNEAKGGGDALIDIEVAAALPDQQWLIEAQVLPGTTVGEALRQLDIAERFAGFEVDLSRLGIFGQRCQVDRVLQAGDRIELYRPLHADPKTIRRDLAKLEKERKAAQGKP